MVTSPMGQSPTSQHLLGGESQNLMLQYKEREAYCPKKMTLPMEQSQTSQHLLDGETQTTTIICLIVKRLFAQKADLLWSISPISCFNRKKEGMLPEKATVPMKPSQTNHQLLDGESQMNHHLFDHEAIFYTKD